MPDPSYPAWGAHCAPQAGSCFTVLADMDPGSLFAVLNAGLDCPADSHLVGLAGMGLADLVGWDPGSPVDTHLVGSHLADLVG